MINITIEDIDHLRERILYNSKDMGELGRYIRIEYVNNFLNDMVMEAEDRP